MRPVVKIGAFVLASGAAILAFQLIDKPSRHDEPGASAPEASVTGEINTALFADSPVAPTFGSGRPLVSQLCTQAQMETPAFRRWVEELKETPDYHNKQWQYAFILQALSERGLLGSGKTGVGFGVGTEPIPALLAKYGADVVATDLEFDEATKQGWAQTNQHMSSLEVLNSRQIVSNDAFKQRVKLKAVDMNQIPDDLQGHDFTWSTCALGHLGNLEKGTRFIENSLRTLKPGGVAVHTTELNLTSDTATFETVNTSVYRKHDIQELVQRLRSKGHEVEVNFHPGDGPLDRQVDEPPYSRKHIKLRIDRFAVTPIGLVIKKSL